MDPKLVGVSQGDFKEGRDLIPLDKSKDQPWRAFMSEPVLKPIDPCCTGVVRVVAELCAIGEGGG
jgi:hypothetical protein